MKNDVDVIVTEKPKGGVAGAILGVVMLVCSVVTTILIPPLGIFGIVVSIVILAVGTMAQKKEPCPACGHRIILNKGVHNVKCRRCLKQFPITWT